MPSDLELTDQDGNSLYVDTTYAEELIIDLNGDVISLTLDQARQLLEIVGGWVAFQSV